MAPPVSTCVPHGTRIAYREHPAGPDGQPPVVLVHGSGGDGRTWDRFARDLVARGRRVVVPDLRGHGRSGRAATYRLHEFADDVVGVCDHLGVATVDLVGHSLGGIVGSLVAQRRPGLVRRLVLEEAPVLLRDGDPVVEVRRRRLNPAELWYAVSATVRSPRAMIAFDRSMIGQVVDQFRAAHPDWWSALPDVRSSVLYLHGDVPNGSMVDPTLLAAASDAIPDCAVRHVPGGHSIHRDHYRRFLALVDPFLAAASSRHAGG